MAAATEASRYLRALARRAADAYLVHAAPRAILLTGSAAQGDSDFCSDVDLLAYYDRVPSHEAVGAAREAIGGAVFRSAEPWSERGFAERYDVHGVEVQVGHSQIAFWEQRMAQVLELHDPAADQNPIAGLLEGVPLHGDDVIGLWRARAAVDPEPLARRVVERHLRFFPLWCSPGYFAARDATLWIHQIRVESVQNVLAVLAALNRQYCSTARLKRMGAFVQTLAIAPDGLAGRLERLLETDALAAATELEALVGETVALVEAHLPEVDTAPVRRWLGRREQPWQPVPLETS
jgi:hypothetical protein